MQRETVTLVGGGRVVPHHNARKIPLYSAREEAETKLKKHLFSDTVNVIGQAYEQALALVLLNVHPRQIHRLTRLPLSTIKEIAKASGCTIRVGRPKKSIAGIICDVHVHALASATTYLVERQMRHEGVAQATASHVLSAIHTLDLRSDLKSGSSDWERVVQAILFNASGTLKLIECNVCHSHYLVHDNPDVCPTCRLLHCCTEYAQHGSFEVVSQQPVVTVRSHVDEEPNIPHILRDARDTRRRAQVFFRRS